jgi:hypothetical protein
MMSGNDEWLVRLRAPEGGSFDALLRAPLAIDIWSREGDTIVAVAVEATLRELERRRLALVERICTTEEYRRRADESE